jgi:two-component system, chemotaxis family, protein-glutamate methylesterase/glutaminase
LVASASWLAGENVLRVKQMPKIRVLVVEDSLTVRKRLCEVLDADSDIEVVGEAEDGKRAIELCRQRRPDVITMDMMLPIMTGLAATEYIMAHFPTPILICSASVNRGELFKTYDALAAGAVDVLDKPCGDEQDHQWDRRFIETVKLVSRIRVITHVRASLAALGRPQAVPPLRLASAGRRQCRVVAIGASTGGPAAIVEILRELPREFELPVLFVLHINEPFGAAFAEWLGGQIDRCVSYARDGEPLGSAAGRVVMAPPDQHLLISNGRFRLTREAERNSCRPSVDVLFESLAKECGASVTACLLTGMGRDGAAGLLAIRRAGGTTIAQDEATSVVYGMPCEAARIGGAERILPLPEIAPALVSLAGNGDAR